MQKSSILLALASTLCLYAAEGEEATNPTTAAVTVSTADAIKEGLVPLHEVKYVSYGGNKGNKIFQSASDNIKHILLEAVKSGASFDALVKIAVQTRHAVAKQSETPKAEQFGKMHKDITPDIAAASMTPVCRYPVIRRLLIDNILSLAASEEWVDLDSMLEYRLRKRTILGWIEILKAEHNLYTPIASYILNLFSVQSDFFSLFNLDETIGLPLDGTMSDRYIKQLKEAYARSKFVDFNTTDEQGEDTPDITLSFLQIRFKETNVQTRSICFAQDAESKPDLGDTAFAIAHPPVSLASSHFDLCRTTYALALQAKTQDEVRSAIGIFQYWWSLSMPVVRGSASIGEWLTEVLYRLHGSEPPLTTSFSQVDQIAHGCLTLDEFMRRYLKLFENPILKEPSNLVANNIRNVIFLSPPVENDGPKNLVQMCDAARSMGFQAYMLWAQGVLGSKETKDGVTYLTVDDTDATPEAYKQTYNAPRLDRKIPLDQSTLVILPEVATDHVAFFEGARVGIHWLSTENFQAVCNERLKKLISLGTLNTAGLIHTYQAPSTGVTLSRWGVSPYPIYGYTPVQYLAPHNTERRPNSIAFRNGALAEQFIQSSPSYQWTCVDGIAKAEEIMDLLKKSILYIDFSDFSGVSDMPRKASALGAVVMLREVGLANDREAYPLDGKYLFNTMTLHKGDLKKLVDDIFKNPHFHSQAQRHFRTLIHGEKSMFTAQMQELLGKPLI